MLQLPRRFLEAQEFCKNYKGKQNPTTGYKLRWHRYQHGLMQSQAAQIMGISENAYKNLENGFVTGVALKKVDKLAKHYGIPVEELVDDYGRFLLGGQAANILACRKELGMGRECLAKCAGIPLGSLRKWEAGKATISRQSWERHFGSLRISF